MKKLSPEAHNRGYELIRIGVMVTVVRIHLARMIAKERDIPFVKAFRWTSIVLWSVFLIGRNWNGGLVSTEHQVNTMTLFNEDVRAANES